jgi:hypothetical protein
VNAVYRAVQVLQSIKGCQAELALLRDRSASACEALMLLLLLLVEALNPLCLLLLSMQVLQSNQRHAHPQECLCA